MFIQNYQTNWKQHVRRMKNNRIPKQIIAYESREEKFGKITEIITGHMVMNCCGYT